MEDHDIEKMTAADAEDSHAIKMREAALDKMLTDMSTIATKIEYVETHLTSCMDQFKYMGDRFHDSLQHMGKLKNRVTKLEDLLAEFEGRLTTVSPIRKHCKNASCRRLLNDQATKCSICGETQDGP